MSVAIEVGVVSAKGAIVVRGILSGVVCACRPACGGGDVRVANGAALRGAGV
ncbi:hypothetical protein GH865_11205 [Rhodocyclus tenuis]|uniref:hypothetical protein n=1 Tax=Rhodocyclus gracilis TaxID=2929842 RepID=UPI001298E86F|nr:hypothetical protein [Rhodocyclus gracilis]MRD73812.1 hypothetical protein [Rhodocyclus gracilis]